MPFAVTFNDLRGYFVYWKPI